MKPIECLIPAPSCSSCQLGPSAKTGVSEHSRYILIPPISFIHSLIDTTRLPASVCRFRQSSGCSPTLNSAPTRTERNATPLKEVPALVLTSHNYTYQPANIPTYHPQLPTYTPTDKPTDPTDRPTELISSVLVRNEELVPRRLPPRVSSP
jgi:hypothetical protein